MLRIFLKCIDKYAYNGLGPEHFTFFDIENPELEAMLSERWWVEGVEVIVQQGTEAAKDKK